MKKKEVILSLDNFDLITHSRKSKRLLVGKLYHNGGYFLAISNFYFVYSDSQIILAMEKVNKRENINWDNWTKQDISYRPQDLTRFYMSFKEIK